MPVSGLSLYLCLEERDTTQPKPYTVTELRVSHAVGRRAFSTHYLYKSNLSSVTNASSLPALGGLPTLEPLNSTEQLAQSAFEFVVRNPGLRSNHHRVIPRCRPWQSCQAEQSLRVSSRL